MIDKIKTVSGVQNFCIVVVKGNCLEGAGICSGDKVAVDLGRRARPQIRKSKDDAGRTDICLCRTVYSDEECPLALKEYVGAWGTRHLVGTHYAPGTVTMNSAMEAKEIFGVAFACWDSSGRLRWKRDISGCPAQLDAVSTIKGNNISDPAAGKGKAALGATNTESGRDGPQGQTITRPYYMGYEGEMQDEKE